MDALALRPRKATEIIDAAIEVYRRNPLHFLLLSAIAIAPWVVLQVIFLAPLEGNFGAMILPATLIALGSAVTKLMMAGFVVRMASDLYLGRSTDAFASIRAVAGRIPAVFVASLLQSVAVFAGIMLFLFPAVWVSAVTFAVLPAVVLEHTGAWKAFDRSEALSRGVKWHVLSGLGLLVIIWFVVKVGIAVLGTAIPVASLRIVVGALADMLLYPVFGIGTTLIYYDIRIRKEGFDIEMMASRASAA